MSSAEKDNTFWLTLRIFGELPSQEAVERIWGTPLDSFRAKDSSSRGKRATHDVATKRLAEWMGDVKSREIFPTVAVTLRNWLPALNQLRTMYKSSFNLSLSAFRETDMGGVEFPDDFLQALVDTKIGFGISIQARFLWEDDEDNEDEKEEESGS